MTVHNSVKMASSVTHPLIDRGKLCLSPSQSGALPSGPAPPRRRKPRGGLTFMAPRKRPDYSQPLPDPLVISSVMTLKTLRDVPSLLGHLPKDVRARSTWQGVAAQLDAAARGADPADVSVALSLGCLRRSS